MALLSASGWWDGNTQFQQVLFIIACCATAVMVIQIIMLLVSGIGGESFEFDGGDTDVFNNEGFGDTAGLRLLNFRTVLAFLSIGSWVTYTLIFWIPWYAALIIGIIAGVGAAIGVAYIMKGVMSLQASGNIYISSAVGKVAEVYLTVPAKKSGTGKINVVVQDTLIEREAVTESALPIKTGEKVKVVGVLDQSTLIVKPISEADSDEGK